MYAAGQPNHYVRRPVTTPIQLAVVDVVEMARDWYESVRRSRGWTMRWARLHTQRRMRSVHDTIRHQLTSYDSYLDPLHEQYPYDAHPVRGAA